MFHRKPDGTLERIPILEGDLDYLTELDAKFTEKEQAVDVALAGVAQYTALLEQTNNIEWVANEAALTGKPAGSYGLTSTQERLMWDGDAVVPGSRGPMLATAQEVDAGLAVRPAYNIQAYGTAQAALDAAPDGSTVDLSAGAGGLLAGLTVNAQKKVLGGYWNAPITAAASLAEPLMTVRPPADGNGREGFVMRDMALLADASGQTALLVDVHGNRKMNRAIFENNYLRSNGGWAMEVLNEATEPDSFATSTIQYSSLHGGLKIRGGGDSLNIIGNGFYGSNASLDIELITHRDAGAGDSSKTVVLGNNSTASGGIAHRLGTRPVYAYNNFEVYGAGSNDALLDLQGGGGAYIDDALIIGNYLAAAPYAKYSLRLGCTNRAYVVYNKLAVSGADPSAYNIYITGDAKNTIIGPNGFEGKQVRDEGVGTMGLLKDLPLAPGRTTLGYRAGPQYIKSAECMVSLMGSVSGGETDADTAIAMLPSGFQPTATQAFFTYCVDGSGGRGVMVYVDTEGVVRLGQALSGTVTEISLGGISFYSPMVP